MTYQLLIKPSAKKELEHLSDSILRRIDHAITTPPDHPRPVGSKKLVGAPLYRIRICIYRVVYEIDANRKTVTIITDEKARGACQNRGADNDSDKLLAENAFPGATPTRRGPPKPVSHSNFQLPSFSVETSF